MTCDIDHFCGKRNWEGGEKKKGGGGARCQVAVLRALFALLPTVATFSPDRPYFTFRKHRRVIFLFFIF